ncbi:hypothetical protein Tco_1270689, partial [Tanacetum coccineum]
EAARDSSTSLKSSNTANSKRLCYAALESRIIQATIMTLQAATKKKQ